MKRWTFLAGLLGLLPILGQEREPDESTVSLIAAYAFAFTVIGVLRVAVWVLDRFLPPSEPENHRITVVRD